jgi:hypothetical protein
MMPDIRGPTSRDPALLVIERWERKIAMRLVRQDRRRMERFMRKLGLEPVRCPICGASTADGKADRCRGACHG